MSNLCEERVCAGSHVALDRFGEAAVGAVTETGLAVLAPAPRVHLALI